MHKIYSSLRDKKIAAIFLQARLHIKNAQFIESFGPSDTATMERQKAKMILRQVKNLPPVKRLP